MTEKDERPWIKLSIDYLDNPKIDALSDTAILLHLSLLLRAGQHHEWANTTRPPNDPVALGRRRIHPQQRRRGRDMHIELDQLWQALQDVDDGQDPGEVYSRVTSESVDPEDEIEYMTLEEEHPHPPCRDKWETQGYCMGSECVVQQNLVMTFRCKCACHAGEEDS